MVVISPNLPLCLFSLSPTPSLDCYNIINATQGSSHTKKNEDKARQCKRSQAIETFKSVNVQFEAGGEACIVFLGGNSGGDVLARPPVWPSSAPVLFSFFKSFILLFILVFFF